MYSNRLLVLPVEVDTCLRCDEKLDRRSPEMEFYSVEDTYASVISIGRCPSCEARYAEIGDLFGAGDEIGMELYQFSSLSIEGQELEVAVWPTLIEDPVGWTEFRLRLAEGMEEMMQAMIDDRRGAGDPGELADLTQVRKTWAIGCREVPGRSSDGSADRVHVAVVVDGKGTIRDQDLFEDARPDADDFTRLLARAATDPLAREESEWPYRVLAGEGVDSAELSDVLDAYDILVESGSPERLELALEDRAPVEV